MADTSVTYEGDGIETSFSIPFPYLSADHVKVKLNGLTLLSPAAWYFSNSSTLKFRIAPPDGSSLYIYRETAGDTRLVDFQNGAVLTEADLDLSANQNFYLIQEAKERLTDLINAEILRIGSGNGIVSTTPDEIIAGLVTAILEDAVALNLSQRVNDIDANAQSILDTATSLQSQINGLAQATAATVFVQTAEPVPGVGGVPDPIPDGARWYDSDDNNHPYIYNQGSTTWIDLADPRIAANESAITALDARLTTAEGTITGQASAVNALNATVYDPGTGVVANADSILALSATVAGNTASITQEQDARADGDAAIAFDVSLIGAANVGGTAFIFDSSKVKIDSDGGDSFATRLSALSVADADNAANITSEQNARINADGVIADELHLLGVQNPGGTAFVLDTATVKLDSAAGVSMAQKFTTLESADGDLNAAITTEQNARIAGDSAIATDLSLLGVKNGGATAWILDTNTVKLDSDVGLTFAQKVNALEAADADNSSSITTIQTVTIPGVQADADAAQSDADTLLAKYGVSLNVNGYVTGFAQNNDGTTGAFVILADKFAVVDPSGDPGETQYTPFSISGGKINLTGQVQVNGSLLVGGSVGSTQISDGAVTTDKLVADLILSTKIRTASSGKRVEIDGVGTYPIWVGDGTKNAANANFYINSSGDMKYSGVLEAGLIKSSLFSPASSDDPFKIAVTPADYSGGTYTGKKAHFFPIRQVNFLDDSSQYGRALTTDFLSDYARFYSPTNTGTNEYGRLGSLSETFLCFFSMNCLGSSYREINCYLEYRYDDGTWREAYKLYTRVNDAASPSAMQMFISKDTAWSTLDFRLRVNAPVTSSTWLRSCSLCVFTPNFGYADLSLGTSATGATTGTFSAADVGDWDDLNLTKKWL